MRETRGGGAKNPKALGRKAQKTLRSALQSLLTEIFTVHPIAWADSDYTEWRHGWFKAGEEEWQTTAWPAGGLEIDGLAWMLARSREMALRQFESTQPRMNSAAISACKSVVASNGKSKSLCSMSMGNSVQPSMMPSAPRSLSSCMRSR